MIKRNCLMILVSFMAFAFAFCGGGGSSVDTGETDDGSAKWLPLPIATPASYSRGIDIMDSGVKIGATGGTIEGTVGTPIEGVTVTIPAGAVSADTIFSLGYNEGGTFSNLDNDLEPGPFMLVLNSGGQTEFDKPLTITYPYTDSAKFPVPFYLSTEGIFIPVTPVPLNDAGGRAGFITWHASDYTFINVDPRSLKPCRTDFSPAVNGFKFSNFAKENDYAPVGRCVGITYFTKWYKESQGDGLSGLFSALVPKDASDKKLTGEEVLATRAHTSIMLNAPDVIVIKNWQVLATIKTNLLVTGKSQPMGVDWWTGGGSHALLAIAYTDNQIAVYDSNHPGKWCAIDYIMNYEEYMDEENDKDDASIVYGTKNCVYIFNGMNPSESYNAMLKDAKDGYHGQSQTKIEISSHANGENVTEENITLEGKIYSGQVLIDYTDVWVEYADGTRSADTKTVNFSETKKDFSVELKMKNGENRIHFDTHGTTFFGGNTIIKNDLQKDADKFVLHYDKKYSGTFTVTSNKLVDWTGTGNATLTSLGNGEFSISGTVKPDMAEYLGYTVNNPEQSFEGLANVHYNTDPPTMYWVLPMMTWSVSTGGNTINNFLMLNWGSSCGTDLTGQGLDWAELDDTVYPEHLKGTFTWPCVPNPGMMSVTVDWDFVIE